MDSRQPTTKDIKKSVSFSTLIGAPKENPSQMNSVSCTFILDSMRNMLNMVISLQVRMSLFHYFFVYFSIRASL